MPIKRIFLLIDLILIALAVYLGVHGIYAFLTSRLDTLPPSSAVAPAVLTETTGRQQPYSDYQTISKRNLFHTKTDSETTTPAVDTLAETKAELKLWGTVAGAPENSFAIIEDLKERQQNVYRQGEKVQNNVTVKMIMTDRVVLSVSGQDEVLKLQDNATSTTSSRTASISASTTASSGQSTPTSRIRLSRTQVDSAMENLTELVGQITVTPYNEDGQQGLKLSNIKANSIFRRMGLRNGDILTAVDGQPLTNVDQAYKLYEDLKSSDTASVQIIRRNKTRNYQYTIK